MSLVMFQMEGSGTVFFLFVREKFGWTVSDYAIYDSMSILVQVLATVIGIYVLKKLCRISDPMIAVIASASLVLDGVAKSVAQVPADLYLGENRSSVTLREEEDRTNHFLTYSYRPVDVQEHSLAHVPLRDFIRCGK